MILSTLPVVASDTLPGTPLSLLFYRQTAKEQRPKRTSLPPTALSAGEPQVPRPGPSSDRPGLGIDRQTRLGALVERSNTAPDDLHRTRQEGPILGN